MIKKYIVSIVFVVATATFPIHSACAGTYKRTAGWLLAAIVSGAVSGYVAAEVSERYTAKKSSINGNTFVSNGDAMGISLKHQGEKEIHLPKGSYKIQSRGVHKDSGLPYIVVNYASINDDLVIFTERA